MTVVQQVNVFHFKKTYYLNRVDNAQDEIEISNLFSDKFHNLCNCASYQNEDMDPLLNDIDGLVITPSVIVLVRTQNSELRNSFIDPEFYN